MPVEPLRPVSAPEQLPDSQISSLESTEQASIAHKELLSLWTVRLDQI